MSGAASSSGTGQERPAPSDLVMHARRAWEHAYAPYSRFRVGAALRADDGTIYVGANVENTSYGLGRCAEQSAVQAMATAGGRSFGELVVYTAATTPASPCGACRQVLFEFSPHATVWLVGTGGEVRITTVASLLPDAFSLDALPPTA
ncbi:cytidine deaminase [soil metagenome]